MDIPPVALAATLAVTGLAVFASFYILAARFLYELAVHQLKRDAVRLRHDYASRIEALRRAGAGESGVDFPSRDATVGVDILTDPHAEKKAA